VARQNGLGIGQAGTPTGIEEAQGKHRQVVALRADEERHGVDPKWDLSKFTQGRPLFFVRWHTDAALDCRDDDDLTQSQGFFS